MLAYSQKMPVTLGLLIMFKYRIGFVRRIFDHSMS